MPLAKKICPFSSRLPSLLFYVATLTIFNLCQANSLDEGWIGGEIDVGNRRTISRAIGLFPFCPSGCSLVFGYIRGFYDSGRNGEGNFGFGYRKEVSPIVFGGYGFYDIRYTRAKNTFHQLMGGFEAYSRCFEARINGYLPLSSTKPVPTGGVGEAEIADRQIFFTCELPGQERPLPGFSGEVGFRFCSSECWCVPEIHLFGGGYYFRNKTFGTVCGPRGRALLTWPRLPLFNGAEFSIGIEGNRDDIQGGQLAGIVRLDFRLGTKKRPCCLGNRLINRIERLDMVVQQLPGPICFSEGFFQDREISDVITIDANTPDVQAAVTAAGADALIIVDGTEGEIVITSTLDLLTGQILAGGGGILEISSDICPCRDASLVLPGIMGTIRQDTDGDINTELTTNNTVQDINFIDGNTSLVANQAADILIRRNTVTNSISQGIRTVNSPRPTISENTIQTTADNAPALFIDLNSIDALVEGNTIQTTGFQSPAIDVAFNSDRAILTNNILATQGTDARGVSITGVAELLVTKNAITTQGATFARGIELSTTILGEVTENTISTTGAGAAAITLFETAGDQVTRNTVSALDGSGVLIQDSGGIDVSKNSFGDIGNFVIELLTNLGISGTNNIWTQQGGGDLCSASGFELGQIEFADPPGATCPE